MAAEWLFLFLVAFPLQSQQAIEQNAQRLITKISESAQRRIALLAAKLARVPPEEPQFCKRRRQKREEHQQQLFLNAKRVDSPTAQCINARELPRQFDARQRWPECAAVIARIWEQDQCGGCWAIASASVISDRICIGSGGTRRVHVSARELLDCAEGDGCEGGCPFDAFAYWEQNGLFSDQCQPFPPPRRNGALQQWLSPLTANNSVGGEKCTRQCDNWLQRWSAEGAKKHFGLKPHWYRLDSGMDEAFMRRELFDNGPVVVHLRLSDQIFKYKSGIYHQQSDSASEDTEFHAMRLIGWGEEDQGKGTGAPLRYWLLANSYGAAWGERGLVRIARGRNELGVEEEVFFARPNFATY